jgi:hypothetical protein
MRFRLDLPEFCDLESNVPIPSLVETEPSTLIISSFGREHLKRNTLEFGISGLWYAART